MSTPLNLFPEFLGTASLLEDILELLRVGKMAPFKKEDGERVDDVGVRRG
mgnify:CR=1 FL=1